MLCRTKTRSGSLCHRAGGPENGRCHLHGGASTGSGTAEGHARIATAKFKHSKAFVAAKKAKGRAITRELKSIEAQMIFMGLLPKGLETAFRVV
jgi:hypothetical protein